ncbi:MAG: flavin reductase [Chloroflexi bacterium]|nr:flavin reductase [Chloroflexota bacterium]
MATTAALRHMLGHFATGVTVVTSRDREGRLRGLTANAFTSLSLDPPRVLVCVSTTSQSYPALVGDGAVFAVNILSARQQWVAELFASKQVEKFHAVDFTYGALDVPLLGGSLGYLECRVVERHRGGDHVLLIAAVEHFGVAPPGEPLLFYRSTYATVAPLHPVTFVHSSSRRESPDLNLCPDHAYVDRSERI